jgi:hypothetical protein
VSSTLVLLPQNAGGSDGINVVPGRFLPQILVGQPLSSGAKARPILKLAPRSEGFGKLGFGTSNGKGGGCGNGKCKPVVDLGQSNVNMNSLLKGIDVDITAPGNPSACGVCHNGAQGATVTDVTVRAADESFACFMGLNGAGGLHGNVQAVGAKVGIYISGAQPIPMGVNLQLVNQSVSAVVFASQEGFSLVGVSITVAPSATGPAIDCRGSGKNALSMVDAAIVCGGANQTAISSASALYLRDAYFRGCAQAVVQAGAAGLPGPGGAAPEHWLHVGEYAKGADTRTDYFHTDVVYLHGKRVDQGVVARTDSVSALPADLLSKHQWVEETFPDIGAPQVADARKDCAARGDKTTDDTAALQACLSKHKSVFLPPGMYRISDTLQLQPGGSLVGMNNGASMLLAATRGFPTATAASPQPMIRTADDSGPDSSPSILAFVGVVTWQHLAHVYTLDWRTQHPLSVWRSNFESRDCECLWLSAYQQLRPTIVPCSLPVNMTIAKSVFRGLGRVYGFVNDDTGAIISTGAKFRNLLINGSMGTPSSRLRFYSLNLEHAQSEANGEIANSSFVDVYSVKGEGNIPMLWLRKDTRNCSVLMFGGSSTSFPYNFSYPPDFAQLSPSMFRVEAGARGVTLAALIDHGLGASAPYWPPSGSGCTWGGRYPYPGEAVPFYPFWTYPNATMWNCWHGKATCTSYYWMVSDGRGQEGMHTEPKDKPALWRSPG